MRGTSAELRASLKGRLASVVVPIWIRRVFKTRDAVCELTPVIGHAVVFGAALGARQGASHPLADLGFPAEFVRLRHAGPCLRQTGKPRSYRSSQHERGYSPCEVVGATGRGSMGVTYVRRNGSAPASTFAMLRGRIVFNPTTLPVALNRASPADAPI